MDGDNSEAVGECVAEGAFEDEDYQPGAGDEEDIDFEDDDDEWVGGWGDGGEGMNGACSQ